MTETIRKQYDDFKEKHPNALLLFRCGDFYEAYEDDAETIAGKLGIILTKNGKDGSRLTGFPHHALDVYLPKLVRAGFKVAIIDQLESPKQTQKVARVQKINPGRVQLPSLTPTQYDLLCECIRYRCADNSRERAEAESRHLLTPWYDEMAERLSELKSLIYNRKPE